MKVPAIDIVSSGHMWRCEFITCTPEYEQFYLIQMSEL